MSFLGLLAFQRVFFLKDPVGLLRGQSEGPKIRGSKFVGSLKPSIRTLLLGGGFRCQRCLFLFSFGHFALPQG